MSSKKTASLADMKFGDCQNCGRKDTTLIDGFCLKCASKRPKGDLKMEGNEMRPMAMVGSTRPATLTERLDAREKELIDNLESVKEAKSILESEPKLKRLLELLSKLCIH